MRKYFLFRMITTVIAASFANNSMAQTFPSLPGSVQPSQVGQAIKEQQPQPAQQPLPPVETKEAPAEKALSAQAQKIKFRLNKIILEGNHVYSTRDLEFIYKSDLHKTISVAQLFGIVQALTNYYRDNGYILSRAILPPQHVKDGVVRIRIIEGYIAKVTVSGSPKGTKKSCAGNW